MLSSDLVPLRNPTKPTTRRSTTSDDYIADSPRSLPEFRLYQPKPGHPDWPRLAEEARAAAERLLPTLEAPQPMLSKLARRASAVRSVADNWLVNRKLHKQGREDLKPFMLLWTALRSCNFTCTYCCDHQGNKYPDLSNEGNLSTAEAIKLQKIMRTRASCVYYAGGEPTLRKDLPELTRAAREMSFYPIIINTNGSIIDRLLEKQSWKGWLADMDIVIVSIDALDLKKLARMWVYKKPHEVFRNLLLLRELSSAMQFKLVINTVIQPDAIEDANDVLDFANDLGIELAPVPLNTGPTIDGSLMASASYRALAHKMLARQQEGFPFVGSRRLNKRLLLSDELSCRNSLKPHVDFDGRLVWPCKATVNVKPEYINVLDFEDVDSLYEHACSKISPTGFHGPARNQCGGNCSWAQNYATDAYAHGLAHPMSLVREVVDFAFGR